MGLAQYSEATAMGSLHYNDRLIFDVGLHIGQDTDFYLKKGFQVVAVEANPLLAQQANEQFADAVASGQLTVLNVGLGEKAGSFPFYVNDTYSEWSSFVQEIGARGGDFHEVEVKCVTADTLFQRYGVPYYLKVDIEGHDIHVVRPLIEMGMRPLYVSVENGNNGLLETLRDAGYTQFKFINQAKVHTMVCPTPALEGTAIEYAFTPGSTGPFGEETVGDWLTYDQVAEAIDAYWNLPNRDENIHGWFDLHAKLGPPTAVNTEPMAAPLQQMDALLRKEQDLSQRMGQWATASNDQLQHAHQQIATLRQELNRLQQLVPSNGGALGPAQAQTQQLQAQVQQLQAQVQQLEAANASLVDHLQWIKSHLTSSRLIRYSTQLGLSKLGHLTQYLP